MTLKEIEIFLMLAKTQNVTKTAQILNLSQSAVSLAIKSLENKLNTKLFNRIGKKLILNENGKLFKEKTEKAYFEIISAENLFKTKNLSGELIFSASKTINNFLLPPIYLKFIHKYPNIKLNKNSKNSKQIIEELLQGKIDFGFIETEFDHQDIIKEELKKDNLIVVSSDKNLTKKEYFIDELLNKLWILREKGSGTRDMFLAGIEDIKIDKFIESDDVCEIKNLLLSPNTITCISELAVKNEIKNKTLYKIDVKNINFQRKFYLIYHKNKEITPIFSTFIEFIRKNIKNS
ncbi:LysR substrate-binding domain-containing protein [Caminibacter pacificus]|uniref:DNA-binding transcriptional LysR family regulator n=1 Tax=Caminibacter pacificus TaxID=1424653 RepID=A0AAJ4RF28_9BACT|nr:LysR substrate-binding domain-containing protein [Caminibacter pacificus]QCI28048.1 LysR family transcriptional regulator [Caminibacter pacificus]ROR41245.1 DNA-binding transcriptional LysR family regulator [Caminibacter pacificus]